jgi:hypothetical protein
VSVAGLRAGLVLLAEREAEVATSSASVTGDPSSAGLVLAAERAAAGVVVAAGRLRAEGRYRASRPLSMASTGVAMKIDE